jgi:hypothetical protein
MSQTEDLRARLPGAAPTAASLPPPLPYSRALSVRRLVDFFDAAGIAVRVDAAWHLFIWGRQVEDIPRLPYDAGPGSSAWRGVVDAIAWRYAHSEASRALKDHAILGAGQLVIPLPREKGYAVVRGREQVAVIRATSAEIPGQHLIYGNFLRAGSQWQQVARVLRRAGTDVPAGSAWSPAQLRRIGQLPEDLGRDLIDACLQASYRIRNERQQAYDRPVVLESRAGELTFHPIGGTPPRLHVPFSLRMSNLAGSTPVRGRLLLGNDDLIPAMIVTDASEKDAITAWVTALLGFADATCFKREGPSRGASGTAGSRPPNSLHRRHGPSGTLRDRRSWPKHLQPIGEWTGYSGAYVAAHRRRLSYDHDHSDEARERAWQVGIVLKSHETWVQAHTRGIPRGIEMRFRWHPPKQLTSGPRTPRPANSSAPATSSVMVNPTEQGSRRPGLDSRPGTPGCRRRYRRG